MGFSFIEDFTSIQGIVCAVVTQTKMTNYKSFFFVFCFHNLFIFMSLEKTYKYTQ